MLCHVRTMFDSSLQISLTVSSAASNLTTASMFMSLSSSPLSSVSTYEQNRQTDRVREIERERESMRERERERETHLFLDSPDIYSHMQRLAA